MKKIIGCLLIAMTVFSATAFSQNNGRALTKDMIKQQLKDSLQLTDDKADSAASIVQEYNMKRRDIFRDQSKSMDDKRTDMQSLNQERDQKLKAFLTDDQLAKFDAMEQRRREQMRQQRNQ